MSTSQGEMTLRVHESNIERLRRECEYTGRLVDTIPELRGVYRGLRQALHIVSPDDLYGDAEAHS